MNADQTLIDVRLAANQEVQVRKFHALTLMVAGAGIIIVTGSSLYGLHLPVSVLILMLLMFFYVKNQKEIIRLVKRYE